MPVLRVQGCNEGQAQESSQGAGKVKAELDVDCENPEMVIKSMEPDMTSTDKFSVDMKPSEKSLKIIVTSNDVGGLLAGVNSTARLIKVANDIDGIDE